MDLNPFIPNKRGNTVIIDGRASQEMLDALNNLYLKVIPTIKCMEVEDPISYHPDIVIHPINYNTLIIAPNVFDYYEEIFYGMGIRLIKGEKRLTREYPGDIAYNVGRIGKLAIHNFKYTDEKLKYYLKKENLEFVNINQGYTKCSIAIIDKNAIITADDPIYRKITSLNVDALLIQPGYIDLKGYPYGFIGGTNGNLSEDEIVFSGRLNNHPDKEKILKFLKKYKKRIIWLGNKKISDIGTLISLYCQ